MSADEELKFEREVEQIEAELGDDHLVRMLQYLTSNSPDASQGLVELHSQVGAVPFKRFLIFIYDTGSLAYGNRGTIAFS